MAFILSNTMIKILTGVVVVMTAVYYNEKPSDRTPCVTISYYPKSSAVYECPAGFNQLSLHSNGADTYTTVSTNPMTEAWSTVNGDVETAKTIRQHLGVPMGLGPGAFVSVDTGNGLVYIESKTKFAVSVAWHEQTN